MTDFEREDFLKVNTMARVGALALAVAMAGCAHMNQVYVPSRCIQRVKWSQPCEAISDSLIKCDGVMLTVSCVSAAREAGGKMERRKFGE